MAVSTPQPPPSAPAAVPDAEFARLAAVVRGRLHLDLNAYFSPQLLRRIGYFCARRGLGGPAALAERLQEDPELCAAFADHLTINVTSFFRDPDRFADLDRVVLPALLAERPALRAWSAGCSLGAEVYSLALLLAGKAPERPHALLATDVDRAAMARAEAALYAEQEVAGIPAALRRHLVSEAGGWRIAPGPRRWVRVQRHDLLVDPPPAGDLDLVLCRNVVIYFTAKAKEGLYARLAAALRPGGYLFVGATEALFQARELGLEYRSACFYRKRVG